MTRAQKLVADNVILNVGRLISDLSYKASDVCQHEDLEELCAVATELASSPDAMQFWIVSDYLASQLSPRDEVIHTLAGHRVWARTTAGQDIWDDAVIQEIAYS